VCVSERFTVVSTPYQENLRHWSRKGDKTGRCSSRWKEVHVTQSVSRGPALKTAGHASTDKIVYCAVHQYIWFSII
jgi:hypothetical protein